MTRFQTIFTAILIFLGVGGAVLFALSKNQGSDSLPDLVMWGTIKGPVVSEFLAAIESKTRDTFKVAYIEKRADTIESEMIAALARGTGPDMILMPQDFIIKQLDKFYIIPYDNFSERSFKDSFIQEGELYLTPEGIIGFPFSVDPLVMYWNREIFTNEGVAQPPTSWTEFFTLAPKITKKDANGNITQSIIAFGETRNVTHPKDLIALLTLQAGSPIVSRSSQGDFVSVFDSGSGGLIPGEQALSYFTEFSNPNKPSYSWNRSLPTDKNAFTAGRLAVYFGYASELAGLRAANPNLDFDIAPVPQAGANGKKVTFGAMNAIAILKSSPYIGSAFVAATNLTGPTLQADWTTRSGFPPVRRDMLGTVPGDAYKAIFYQSALIAKGWLDPNREGTDAVFTRLVENVTSGRLRVSESVRGASLEINNLLKSNI